MKTKQTKNITKRLGIWAVVVAGILMIPLILKAPWTGSDFVFAGVVLFGSASVYEFTTYNMKNKTHRLFVGIAVALVILLIWAWAVA